MLVIDFRKYLVPFEILGGTFASSPVASRVPACFPKHRKRLGLQFKADASRRVVVEAVLIFALVAEDA
jgi:hypothetical protein